MAIKTYEQKYEELCLTLQRYYEQWDIALWPNADNKSLSFYSMDTHHTIKIANKGVGRNKFTNQNDAFKWFQANLKSIENEDYNA